mgnify:FL=1
MKPQWLQFRAADTAHLVTDTTPDLLLWRLACGTQHHATTGRVVRGAVRCLACVQLRRRKP